MKLWIVTIVVALAVGSLWVRPTSDSSSMIGRTANPDLTENSGAAMSHSQPGVFFSINDSGNEPLLYATDTSGADRGVWRVTGATNVDWEAVSIGPCMVSPRTASPQPSPRATASSCVYIGDVGDNRARYPTRVIYRVPEPKANTAGFRGATPPAERLEYIYSPGPRDVEAMYVDADGSVNLITKRPHKGPDGRGRPALVFRIPGSAWQASALQIAGHNAPMVAQLVDSLPVILDWPTRVVTDAALSANGKYLAVRTYSEIYTFAIDARRGGIDPKVKPAICNIAGLGESQGEGITWYDSTGTYVLTSEGKFAPVHVVRCPLP